MATQMDNASLKAICEKFGEKIFYIGLDNGHKIFFNAPSSNGNVIHVQDIVFETFGSVDMFGIKHKDNTYGDGIDYTTWLVTSYVQHISTTDELTQRIPDLNRFF
jgi:hypothetical protein